MESNHATVEIIQKSGLSPAERAKTYIELVHFQHLEEQPLRAQAINRDLMNFLNNGEQDYLYSFHNGETSAVELTLHDKN